MHETCLQSDDREDIHMILKLNFLNEEVILNHECLVCLSKHNASGKESGGSWKICYSSPKKIFVEWWRLGEGYESGVLC